LRVVGDTAFVDVKFDETRHCPGTRRTTGSGWATTVMVPRDPRQGSWGAALSRRTLVGDGVGC
jgi:hypothetical protein